MTPGSSAAVQELDSLQKHQVKVTTSVKDYFDVVLTSDYSSAVLPLPQFVLLHVPGAM